MEGGKGLGKDCTGRTENVPFPLQPVGFKNSTAWTWSSSWGVGWDDWGSSRSGHTGSASSAWGVGLQPGSQASWSWSGSASWAEQEGRPIEFRKQTDHDQYPQWEQLEKPATEYYQLANEDDHQEEAGSSTQMKKKKKKSKNKGAHKRWIAEEMHPDDYGHEHPKWCYWSGKLGWAGFARSSWNWLDELHQRVEIRRSEICDALDIGGWDYHMHMDPAHWKLESDDVVGYQVAMHDHANKKVRKNKKFR